jgi:NUMOD3 motif
MPAAMLETSADSTVRQLTQNRSMQTIYKPYKDGHQVDPLRPIFYIIQNTTTGIYYAGYKKNTKAFMVEGGYVTSCDLIKRLIDDEGISQWRIMKIRYFETGIQASLYEGRFLRRIDALHNPTFYNRSNGYVMNIFCSHKDETKKRISKSLKYLKNRFEVSEKISRALTGKSRSIEVRKKISSGHIGKRMSDAAKLALSRSLKGKSLTQQTKDKISIKLSGIKKNPFTQSHKKNISNSCQRFFISRREFAAATGYTGDLKKITKKMIEDFRSSQPSLTSSPCPSFHDPA